MTTRFAITLGFALILAGCAKTNSPTTPTPTPDANTVSIIAGSGRAYDDPAYKGGSTSAGFTPGQLTVATGTTVKWQNNDSVDHQPTADDGSAFQFSFIDGPGENHGVTFATAGTFTYHCMIHPNMTGTIKVQ
jgi:plastocyanin